MLYSIMLPKTTLGKTIYSDTNIHSWYVASLNVSLLIKVRTFMVNVSNSSAQVFEGKIGCQP